MDKVRLVKVVKEACAVLGYKARSYSGRGMFGKTCLGIEMDRGSVPTMFAFELASYLYNSGEGDILEDLTQVGWCQDSVGLGSITYAPYVPWVDEDLEETEEDEEELSEED